MKQKIRSEIKEEDTWDLSLIFKDEKEFNKSLNETKKEITKLTSFKGQLLSNAKTLLDFLEISDDIERKLYK